MINVLYIPEAVGMELPQIITIDKGSEIAGRLFRKNQEYTQRIEKNKDTSSKKYQDSLAKWMILSILLTNGKIDILQALKESVKAGLEDLASFENAWGVIGQYANPNGKQPIGGTGLPR